MGSNTGEGSEEVMRSLLSAWVSLLFHLTFFTVLFDFIRFDVN